MSKSYYIYIYYIYIYYIYILFVVLVYVCMYIICMYYLSIYMNTHLVLVHDLIRMHTSPFLYVSRCCVSTLVRRVSLEVPNTMGSGLRFDPSVPEGWKDKDFPHDTSSLGTRAAVADFTMGKFVYPLKLTHIFIDSHLYDWYFVQDVWICLIHRCILYSELIWCDMLLTSSDCWVNIVICLQYLYPDPDPTLA